MTVQKSFLPLLVVVLISLWGCASIPPISDPSGVDVAANILSDEEIRIAYGLDDQTNPFMTPRGVLVPKTNEFIVLKLKVRAAKPASFTLVSLRAITAEGTAVARFYDVREFCDFWKAWSSDEQLAAQKVASVKKHYLDGWSYTVRGSSERTLTLVGKMPIPRPFSVEMIYYIDGGPARKIVLEGP